MPVDHSVTFICDNPTCPGANEVQPAEASSKGADTLPPGWIMFRGDANVGDVQMQSSNYFHSVTCAQRWFEEVVVPGLQEVGAA